MEWQTIRHSNRVIVTSTQPESVHWNSWIGPSTSNLGTLWPSTNRAIFIPFVVFQPFIIDKMAVINGSAVSGNIDVGVYDSEGNRLVSSGSQAQSTITAIQSFDVTNTTIYPGIYYMACVLDNTTGRLVGFTDVVTLQKAYGILSMSTAFPLPNPATFATAADSFYPAITLYGRSVV